MIKKHSSLLLGFLVTVSIAGCSTTNKIKSAISGSTVAESSSNTPSNPELAAQIRAEKKRQSELDLPYRGFNSNKKLETIAIGSCSNQDLPQPIWKTIEKNEPDLFIHAGDTVYSSHPEQKPLTAQFRKMNLIPEYRDIREKVPFMAIWDDHDYGQNDGGIDNPEKETYRTEFVRYWNYLGHSLPNDQKAIYHSRIFGSKKQRVQVIVLDTRWDRSPLKKNTDYVYDPNSTDPEHYPRPYLPVDDKNTQILSKQQWSWLESELKKPAELRFIVSSIQVIANDHNFEKWGNFPHEREKFFNLLKKTRAKNVILLSGDRHMAALAKIEIPGHGSLVEMTASGLNMPAKKGNITKDTTYIKEGYRPVNFGLINIDWNKKSVKLEIRSLEDTVPASTEVQF